MQFLGVKKMAFDDKTLYGALKLEITFQPVQIALIVIQISQNFHGIQDM